MFAADHSKFDLGSWKPAEESQLVAMRNAACEFLEALQEARDNVRRKAASKAAKSTPQNPSGPSFSLGAYNRETPFTELSNVRGDIVDQGETFFRDLKNSAEEKDIKAACRATLDKVIEVLDHLYAVLLADRHVENYKLEALIQEYSRRDCKEEPTLRIANCSKVQVVSYQLVDAYGTPRVGKVVVGLYGNKTWDVAKENGVRGGFFELIKSAQ